MKNDKGDTIRSRKGIATVFGEFYSKLYAATQLGEETQEPQNMETKTNKEKNSSSENVNKKTKYQSSHKLKYKLPTINSTKGKASDNNGIGADDIKTCDATTKEMMRQIFNDVLKQDDCTPETWRIIRVKVICKKGNVEKVDNYRPICALPALYTPQRTRPSAI